MGYVTFIYHPRAVEIEPLRLSEKTTPLPVYTADRAAKELKNIESGLINCNYSRCSPAWLSTFLLIIVPVRPWGIRARQLIRNTWYKGFKDSEDCMLRFAIGGRELEPNKMFEIGEENRTYGDIIYVDSVENPGSLTNKTMALMRWAHLHVDFSYLMKSDDDTYVFVKNMITELRKRSTNTKLYYGIMLINNPPIRGNYLWADSEWDLGLVYLPFAMGGGYILSHDLVQLISMLSSRLKWHVNEDTAIGAWVSAFDHERRSDNMFCQSGKLSTNPPGCNETILAHLFFGYSDDEIWQQFNLIYKQVNSNRPIKWKTTNSNKTDKVSVLSTSKPVTISNLKSTRKPSKINSTAISTKSVSRSTKKQSVTTKVSKPTNTASTKKPTIQRLGLPATDHSVS